MRSHTAAHVFASILCIGTGALVAGNQLEGDTIRFDFSLENFDWEILKEYVDEANELFRRDIPVRWYELPREEGLKISVVVKMDEAFWTDIPYLRIVDMGGVDKQSEGGARQSPKGGRADKTTQS